MIIVDCEQGTQEWFEARCGIPTASCFDKIITSTGAKSKQFQGYLNMLAGESLVGVQESYKSEAMQRGNDLEPDAITMFEFMTDQDVQRVGLCYKDEEKAASCSPDALVGDHSGLEIKCPALATHVGYVRANKIPAKYVPQVQGSMYVTGRKSWYFMSYFPRLKPLLIEVKRDDEFIKQLDDYLTDFNDQLSSIKQFLR
tara:strand:- start:1105 stop:1701 length:597 start_codon:yes stop_codon:yes gene_type:complete